MSRKNHKPQHKQEREERKSKELQDLKRDNHRLEKQVARLRKQIAKSISESEEIEEKAQEEEGERYFVVPTAMSICECGATESTSIKGPGGKLYVYCNGCKKRL